MGLETCPFRPRRSSSRTPTIEEPSGESRSSGRHKIWRDTYGFKNVGEISAPETREFVWRYIKGPGDQREGWDLDDIKDPEARRVVGFMNPIFHPEKPKRITIKWASVFLGAMDGEILRRLGPHDEDDSRPAGSQSPEDQETGHLPSVFPRPPLPSPGAVEP